MSAIFTPNFAQSSDEVSAIFVLSIGQRHPQYLVFDEIKT
jgi:hypothetical protein